jgi:hypothetical protein
MDTIILVRSSSRPEPYAIHAVFNPDTGLSLHCNCPAGEWGKFCKHKIRLASGDEGILYDDDQKAGFHKIMQWVEQTSCRNLLGDLAAAERQLQQAKNNVKALHEKIARLMREGIK